MLVSLSFIIYHLSCAQAQAQAIGFLSYDSLLTSMPQYAIVEKQMADLQQAYDAELKRAEEEFNQKYEAFLDGRKDFPRTIMLKRQTELQQLLQRNVDFKQQAQGELKQARQQAMKPLRQQLNEAIALVAHRHGLAVVVNTDAEACPYIDPALAIDISVEVRQEVMNSMR
jgi:outer membrane protein